MGANCILIYQSYDEISDKEILYIIGCLVSEGKTYPAEAQRQVYDWWADLACELSIPWSVWKVERTQTERRVLPWGSGVSPERS